MNEETKSFDQIAIKRMTRRTFLTGMAGSAALGAFGLGIASCSSGSAPAASGGTAPSTGAGTSAGTAPAAKTQSYAGRTLRIMLNGGQYEETVRGSTIASLEKKYGAKVEVVPANSGEMLTRLRAEKSNPTVDACIIDDMVAVSGIADGLFEKIDAANIPNLKDVDPIAVDPNGYGPYVHASITAFSYNKDLIKVEPPAGWADLWDPKYKGMLTISAINLTPGVQFLVQAAMLNGGSYENIDPGFQALKRLQPNMRKWLKEVGEVKLTVTREPVFMVFGQGQSIGEIDNGVPLVLVHPKEGAHLTSGMAQIVKGSKNKDLAELFIDEYLAPENQAAVTSRMYYKTFNKKIQLTPQVKARIPDKITMFDPFKIAKYREEWTARWLREIGG